MPPFYEFKDRTVDLFGRQADIEHLLGRVSKTGLTAICGRPQMGKTWLLEQVGWQLGQQGVLVGYHELRESGDDHLLRTVEDLYRRWLSEASMTEQAVSIFKRHKGKLISGAGRMIGAIFKEVAGKAAGAAINEVLKAFADLDQDLKTGGLELPPLDYDTAMGLTQLIYDESDKKPVVLILDAWEKSSNIEKVYNTLEAFLKHTDEWCPCHMILGIREPELRIADATKAYELAEDLAKLLPAELTRLKSMDLGDGTEAHRMLNRLGEIAPEIKKIDDQTLLSIVDGFPGVIYRIRGTEDRHNLNDEDAIRELAQDAQNYRYREFEQLLPPLKGDQLTIAVRITVLHQLTEQDWPEFKEILCEGIDPLCWEDLAGNVFDHAPFPTYGHATRHESAFSFFESRRLERSKAELENIVLALAGRIKYIDYRDERFATALRGLKEKVYSLGFSDFHSSLCAAAGSLFGETCLLDLQCLDTALLEVLEKQPDAASLILIAMNNRGVGKSEAGDNQGAIADFTAVIELEGAPVDQVAQALINRGVYKGKAGDNQGAIADYTAVIELEGAPVDQVARALNNRGVSKGEADDNLGAIADYTAVIEMEGAPVDGVAQTLYNRGFSKGEAGDDQGAIADYTALIELEDAPVDRVANALNNRGIIKGKAGDNLGAIADFTAVIELEGVPVDQVANALINRGVSKSEVGDNQGAIADFTAVIELVGAPVDRVARALNNRSSSKGKAGDDQGAIADYTAVIELEDAPVDQVAQALYNRGVRKGETGDSQGEIADYTALIELEDAPVDQVARALNNRGVGKGKAGDNQGAGAEFTAVIEMEGAPADQVAKAFFNRGVSKGKAGDNQGEIADYTALIELEDAPVDQVAKALYNRGVRKGKAGDDQGEIADYTAVIEMEDAPVDQVAKAFYNRGFNKSKAGDSQGEIADFTAVIELEGAPVDQVANALINRGISKSKVGDNQGEIADYTAVIEMEGAPVDLVAKAYANSTHFYLAEGRAARAIASSANAICSGSLPDGGLMIIDWFKGKSDDLKIVIEDRSAHYPERGCALAFLAVIDCENVKAYVESWLNDDSFGEASKVFLSIRQIWQDHLTIAGNPETKA